MKPALTGAGYAVLVLVLCLSFGPVLVLLLNTEPGRGLGPADWAAIRFTLWQSVLSAAISCALAIPVARALMRRRFPFRDVLVAALGAPFLLPAIIAVLGLLTIWGRAGVISDVLVALGGQKISIYGLNGILLAHVFFNLPLVTRLIIQGWHTIPPEHFRLAAQLDMPPSAVQRWLERPMLRAVLPGAFLLVFLLCMTSFAVALALGGGPRATTIELAIYQALRFEFDLGAAALLALIQFMLCGGVALLAFLLTKPVMFGADTGRSVQRWDAPAGIYRFVDGVIITTVTLFLMTPMLALVARGLFALLSGMPGGLFTAAATSVTIALGAMVISMLMALSLAGLIAGLRGGVAGLIEGLGLLMLSASPFVIGTGLFIVINPFVSPFALAIPVVILINAAMSLPFALRILIPAIQSANADFGRLSDSLGITGFAHWRLVLWPNLRRPLGFAAGLTAAMSMGDLGVITLFAPPGIETLPLYMYNLMGAYRMQDAAGAALVLVVVSMGLFWIFDRGGRFERSV